MCVYIFYCGFIPSQSKSLLSFGESNSLQDLFHHCCYFLLLSPFQPCSPWSDVAVYCSVYQHSVLVFQIINFLFCICCFLLKCISSTLCFLSRRNMDVPISQVKLSAQFFLKQFKTCSRYTLICLTLSTSAAHFPSPAVRHAKCSFILMVFAGVCILWNSLKLSQLRVFCLWSLLSVPH